MIHGLDTGFLVAAEVREHAEHAGARVTLTQLLSAGDVIAIAPQVLAEFIQIVTDPRRFTQPLDMNAARHVAEQWWTASDVVHALPDAGAVQQFLTWLHQYSLGRKRLLDTHGGGDLRSGGGRGQRPAPNRLAGNDLIWILGVCKSPLNEDKRRLFAAQPDGPLAVPDFRLISI